MHRKHNIDCHTIWPCTPLHYKHIAMLLGFEYMDFTWPQLNIHWLTDFVNIFVSSCILIIRFLNAYITLPCVILIWVFSILVKSLHIFFIFLLSIIIEKVYNRSTEIFKRFFFFFYQFYSGLGGVFGPCTKNIPHCTYN